MQTLTVLVGLPGSGKSSVIRKWNSDDAFVYSTDDYIEHIASLNSKTYNDVFHDQIKRAVKHMDLEVVSAFRDKKDVIWDQTCLNPKKRASILAKTPKDYTKHCICIVPPRNQSEWDELQRRLANRPGKNIPDNVIESMARRYVEPSVDEGFDTVTLYNIFGQPI